MFVINPDPYLIPAYRISPFKTDNISFNHRLPNDNIIDEYFCQRFNGNKFIYTVNGRSALQLALMQYNLQKEDIVTIFTTSGNNYISKCVTNEIEKICKWSRSIEVNTRIIIVNHEFGYPYKELEELKRYRLPIIEDCAFSFFSIDKKSIIGSIGDFTIFSFPKIFPIQIGGLLVLNTNFQYPVEIRYPDNMTLQYIKKVLSYYILRKDEIIEKRIQNYQKLKILIESIGLKERFKLEPGIIPGVFLFNSNGQNIHFHKLKEHMYRNGIQCSVFYGEKSFFIHSHQNLNDEDIAYFVETIKLFLNQS